MILPRPFVSIAVEENIEKIWNYFKGSKCFHSESCPSSSNIKNNVTQDFKIFPENA